MESILLIISSVPFFRLWLWIWQVFIGLIVFPCAILAQGTFVLTGSINDPQSSNLYLLYRDYKGDDIRDTCMIENGHFSFKGNITEPTWAILIGGSQKIPDYKNPNIIDLFLSPAKMTAVLTYNHFNDMKMRGSASQDEYEELTDQFNAIDKNSDLLDDKYSEIAWEFIAQHPRSYVSAYELACYKTRWIIDSVKKAYSMLDSNIKNSIYGREAKQVIDDIENNSEGHLAKGILAIDVRGDSLRLSDFRGKCVLLDFWGSWCVPCRKSITHLIDLYTKFHSRGFEVIGIAQEYDPSGMSWKKAIKNDGSGIWYNILSKVGENGNHYDAESSSIAKDYGIHVLPTMILVGKTGVILGRYTGTDEEAELDRKLAKLFE